MRVHEVLSLVALAQLGEGIDSGIEVRTKFGYYVYHD